MRPIPRAMKDCLGNRLIAGDKVAVVVPIKPIPRGCKNYIGKVIKPRGREVGIKLESDWYPQLRYVLPDSIMKYDWWRER